ncbi:MAG: cation diffusion facilitator family transporter [Bacillota bacterium]|jgi:cation diffusion facilitator family transporter|nr:cation diffusion facilitator family transporter [Bacillota bacterium]NLM08905.1 cation transporter [Clostridiales Family XIII bacterium]HAF60123.1 cation-efflux pump [Clostridiales bacterium UBA9856]HOA42108.1 cation diffusion facilitator family transporter [Bacillota bacterium]HPZ59367.1 cation diffusion facilitator family transporter [Bacillota bacterium]
MGKFLVRLFVKDYKKTKDPVVRDRYGRLIAVVGILSNLLLSGAKIATGLLFGSIAIFADGMNNLADASSAIILLIGIRLAAKPADEGHPYGHARIEYITGLLISFFIVILGFQLLRASIDKIRFPEPIEFSWLLVAVLAVSILVKIWQALFYTKVSRVISSSTIKATAADSRNDVISTSAVLLSLFIGEFASLQLDGIMGALVAAFVIYSGVRLVLETSSPLLGNPPDPELVNAIRERILAYEGVLGIHDLIVHNYGPGRIFATVHVEVSAHGDLIASHDMVDDIEREISEELKIRLVAHMDPLDTEDPLTAELNTRINEIITALPGIIEIHDLRVVAGYSHHKIIFDVVVDPHCPYTDSELKKLLNQKIKELSSTYYSVITVDRNYVKGMSC